MNSLKISLGLALTTLTVLLAACGPQGGIQPPVVQPPAVQDPAATAPASPIAGTALEITQMPVKAQRVAATLNDLATPGPDMDDDLKALLAVLGLPSQPPLSQPLALNISSPAQLGRELARTFGRGSLGPQTIQVEPVRVEPMMTGTTTVSTTGVITSSTVPTDRLIMDNQQRGFRLEVDWHVGGAPSVWVEHMTIHGLTRTEVPTKARGTITRAGILAAQGDLTLAPGDCFFLVGPTALTFSGWAGKQSAPAAKTSLDYAWTDAGIKASASAEYKTKSLAAKMSADLDLRGTTMNRCNPNTFTFTPTRADLNTSLKIPDQTAEARLYLRDLSNLTFSADAMRAQNPLQSIKGSVNASVKYNGAAALSAFGPLADGGDLDLQPGDQVRVKYVKNGVLVEKNLPEALADLPR